MKIYLWAKSKTARCPAEADFYTCSSGSIDQWAEHYFLALMVKYRVESDEFRAAINGLPDGTTKSRRRAQYKWFRDNWYSGAEFKRGVINGVSLVQDGVLCLPGECQVDGLPGR